EKVGGDAAQDRAAQAADAVDGQIPGIGPGQARARRLFAEEGQAKGIEGRRAGASQNQPEAQGERGTAQRPGNWRRWPCAAGPGNNSSSFLRQAAGRSFAESSWAGSTRRPFSQSSKKAIK